jgi:hypothetical protein
MIEMDNIAIHDRELIQFDILIFIIWSFNYSVNITKKLDTKKYRVESY